CGGATSSFRNCSNLACRVLVLICDSCQSDPANLDCKPHHTRGKRLQEVG
ncbi:MAG: hypothetical protein VW959_02190, partial [Aquiluna sp.]